MSADRKAKRRAPAALPGHAAKYFREWFALTYPIHVAGDRDATFFNADVKLAFEKGYFLGRRNIRRG